MPHDDPIVVSLNIANYDIHRVLVDNRSSINVLFYNAFIRMNLNSELLMKRIIPLIGFLGITVLVERTISLATIIGRAPKQVVVQITYFVVKSPSMYNAIISHPELNALRAIVSTYHLMVKFSTLKGVGELRRNQQLAKECHMATLRGAAPIDQSANKLNVRDEKSEQRGQSVEDLIAVPIGGDLDKWYLPGVDTEIMVHQFNIGPKHHPVKQKKHPFAPDQQKAIREKMDKRLKAGFIQEVYYPEWLTNIVPIPKANGK
ncbi:uncharacterized protein [Elaeis guineensis]|uniref:uncharacterized protein n=1 Tax=Elaeis guineensis var. tenera TaxID=51953 RepID=UPI003C6D5935